jgi:predicted nuclease of restriction endonuclease-like (RecB) superfamily
MCRIERWSVRALRSRIDSMLFERTALPRKPAPALERLGTELATRLAGGPDRKRLAFV